PGAGPRHRPRAGAEPVSRPDQLPQQPAQAGLDRRRPRGRRQRRADRRARRARRRGGDRPRRDRAPGRRRGPRGHPGPQPRSPARAARAGRPAPADPPLTTGTTRRRPWPEIARLPPALDGASIGTIMTEPIWASMAASRRAGGVSGIGAVALADLLGHWPTADGPLYRLLATRIARLADTGELSAGLRLPPER